MEKLRVGIDFRGAQTSGERGIGRYGTDLVLGLVEHAPEVEVTLFVKPGSISDSLRGKVRTVIVDANYWNGPNASRVMHLLHRPRLKRFHSAIFQISMQSQRAEMEKALRENPVDVLHIVSALDVGSYPIYDAPCPVVMTFLDAIVIALKEITYDRFPGFLQTYFREEAKNLSRAERIVAISEASKLDATKFFGLDPDRIDVVYPAVSAEFGEAHPRPDRAPPNPYFVFCSSPDPHKNPEPILRAFATLERTHSMVFISPAEHPEVARLTAIAEELGFNDRFVVTGKVSEPELIGYFQHAEAVVSPSQMEGFGLPVAQALRAGTPVITSNTSAQAEIAREVGILVSPNSIEEIAAAMRKLIEMPLTRPVTAGQLRAKLFDSKRVTELLVETYSGATKKHL